MNQQERIRSAIEELEQVRSNMQATVRALYLLHQDGLAGDIDDWDTIINSAIFEIRDAQDKELNESLKNAKEQSALLLTGILSTVEKG